jgi:hypothetical protein
VRAFPISNWTELDVWRYIEREEIPLPSLYFAHEREVYARDGMWRPVGEFSPPRGHETVEVRTVRYRTAVCRARFLGGHLVRAVWLSMFVDGKWKAERLLLSTDPGHTAEDVIMTYSLRWTIEPMFAALKWGEGMIDMWMQSVETFHRWLNVVYIGRSLSQMLAVKADAATQALAQVAAWRKEPYLTAGMVKAGLVRAFWNIAPAEAWHHRGRKFDPSRRLPMTTRVVRTAIAA